MKTLLAVAVLVIAARAQAAQVGGQEWMRIGKPFGQNAAWQFGLDTSKMPAGGCVQRELNDGQWLAGPCRDILLLGKQQDSLDPKIIFHLGAYAMANSERANWAYGPRLGINTGQAAKLLFGQVVSNVPYLESLADWKAPAFISYLDKVLTLDYGVGYRPIHKSDVHGNLTHGPMVKLDLPINDVIALLRLGL